MRVIFLLELVDIKYSRSFVFAKKIHFIILGMAINNKKYENKNVTFKKKKLRQLCCCFNVLFTERMSIQKKINKQSPINGVKSSDALYNFMVVPT